MNRTVLGCFVAGAIGLVIGAVVIGGMYNSMVSRQEAVIAAWGNVQNVYQRRADLVPNLVATVQGSADFERETLEAVTNARASVGQVNIEGAPDLAELQAFQAAQGELSSALSRLLVTVEAYPQIQSTAAYRDLLAQLEGTENRITVERGRYNEVAQSYNTARRRFPMVLVAGLLGFDERPYFEAEEGAEQAPEVDFSSDDG